ncbi:MAG: ABC-2 type transporter [Candidatus Roizmanbacteria bacterium GW2011_GWA2_32_13]|uniref:ABC-2 type transporter n=1 Tax=Candidatus Roizmanbacteria bacterium GW2011_GWA2_32_13 TaxID=1618475 RepID=A0A0F9Z1E6_9BACT|nr:MAG: ABC-2 type transporter [Candidatus Roizmanbacteria bacterium GW2011_GWA2_32_13]
MSLNRIKAILIHEVFISKHSFEIFNDIFLYPLFSIIVFGFMTLYLTGSAGKLITDQVLAGMIFWQVINIAQYSIGVGCLWDVWSRNLFSKSTFIDGFSFQYLFNGVNKYVFRIY